MTLDGKWSSDDDGVKPGNKVADKTAAHSLLLTVPVGALLRSRWKSAAAGAAAALIALNAVHVYRYERNLLPHNHTTCVSYTHFGALILGRPDLERMVPPAP